MSKKIIPLPINNYLLVRSLKTDKTHLYNYTLCSTLSNFRREMSFFAVNDQAATEFVLSWYTNTKELEESIKNNLF